MKKVNKGLVHKIGFYWNRTLITVLLGLAAWELIDAGRFFFISYPELDRQLAEHAISSEEVKILLGEAAAGAISSFFNIFIATNLVKAHERITHFIELLFGSSLVVWHAAMVEWLATIDYVAIWQQLW